MAQAWRRLGAEEVTIIEGGEHLLQNEEPFAGQEVEEAFAAEGITVHTGCKAVNASRDGDDGPVSVTLDDGRVITGDELLVAVGRRPATTDIGLETVGLEPGKYVEVDDQLRAKGVDGGWLYAVGDVNGRALLTHMGKYQARLAADHIRGRRRQRVLRPWDHPARRVHRPAGRIGRDSPSGPRANRATTCGPCRTRWRTSPRPRRVPTRPSGPGNSSSTRRGGS